MTEQERERILIVDDEPDLLGLFETWLTTRWCVETATDGRAALERFDERIDVLVLDRRMPGMSGDAVLERIHEAGHDCHVVFVSAAEPDAAVFELSFDKYLVKPVARDELVDTVDAVLTSDGADPTLASSDAQPTPGRIFDGHRERQWDPS